MVIGILGIGLIAASGTMKKRKSNLKDKMRSRLDFKIRWIIQNC